MVTDGLQELKLIFHQELDVEKRKKNRIIQAASAFYPLQWLWEAEYFTFGSLGLNPET